MQVNGLYSGGSVIGGLVAIEIWGGLIFGRAYFRGCVCVGGGANLLEFCGSLRSAAPSTWLACGLR